MIAFTEYNIVSWLKEKKESGFDELDIAFGRWEVKSYLFSLHPDATDSSEESVDAEGTLQEFNHLITICNTNLDSNPDDLKSLIYRSAANFRSDKFDDAMIDFNKVVELAPTKPDLYLERARYFQRHHKYSEAIEDYSISIELDPAQTELYSERAKCYQQKNRYVEAINDYSKAIEHNPEGIEKYLIERAVCYARLDKIDEALSDYNRSIDIKSTSDAYLGRGKIYFDLDKAFEDFTRSIELSNDNWEAYLLRGEIYEKQEKYELAEQDYSKSIEIWPDNGDAYFQRAELYNNHMSKLESAIADYKSAVYNSSTLSYSPHDVYDTIIILSENLVARSIKLQNELNEKVIREEERKKIIADLSHSIKNLISTVIDPLENLKQDSSVKSHVIENALKGANLIREIVNAMNLSFKGSIDDFQYDATHNTDAESQSLKSIFIAALKHSVGNMFDSKYFGTFMRKYFPDKSLYMEAKAEWSAFSQSNDLNELLPFLHHYFFRTDFVLDNAEQLIIGNQKGSIIKLLILCQELILNAVKYSAFIDKENRFLRIHFVASDQFVSILVENSFDKKSKVKTSGIGHVIIQNFAQLLGTTPTINHDGGIYSVEIRFGNIWKEAKA